MICSNSQGNFGGFQSTISKVDSDLITKTYKTEAVG
jgi:hypothetical protein